MNVEIKKELILKYLGMKEKEFIRRFGIDINDLKEWEVYISLGLRSLLKK